MSMSLFQKYYCREPKWWRRPWLHTFNNIFESAVVGGSITPWLIVKQSPQICHQVILISHSLLVIWHLHAIMWGKRWKKEYDWLSHVEKLHTAYMSHESNISCTAYDASRTPESNLLPSINVMLPLFAEAASSSSMLRHCFDVIQAAVQHVEPGQIPVICIVQPLLAKLKQSQWSMHSQYGDDEFVILVGRWLTTKPWTIGWKRVDGFKPFRRRNLPLLELQTPSPRPRMSLGPGMPIK